MFRKVNRSCYSDSKKSTPVFFLVKHFAMWKFWSKHDFSPFICFLLRHFLEPLVNWPEKITVAKIIIWKLFCSDNHSCYLLYKLWLDKPEKWQSILNRQSSREGGVLPYVGYIGMCRCEGYGFQVVYSRIGYINQSVWV